MGFIDFLNSNFMTSLLGAGAGAWAGAYAAQRISERAQLRERYLKEIKSTNALVSLLFQMTNTVFNLKSQHVLDLVNSYDKEREGFEVQLQRARAGLREPGERFIVKADFETLDTLTFPLDHLQALAFETLSLPTRPLTVTSMLVQAVHALNRTIEQRNNLVDEFRRTGPHDGPELVSFYFGKKDAAGNHDNRYGALVRHIAAQTDDCIYFSSYLVDDIVLHGHRYRSAFRKKFRGPVPKIGRPQFNTPRIRELMPPQASYADLMSAFRLLRPDHLRIVSLRRKVKRRMLSLRRKLRWKSVRRAFTGAP